MRKFQRPIHKSPFKHETCQLFIHNTIIPFISLEYIVGQRPFVIRKAFIYDVHERFRYGKRKHALIVSVPGLEKNTAVYDFEDSCQFDRSEMEPSYLDLGPFVFGIFSEEKVHFATLEHGNSLESIDQFELPAVATFKSLDINPALIVDFEFPVLHNLLHKLIILDRLLESPLKTSHVLEESLTLPLLAEGAEGRDAEYFDEVLLAVDKSEADVVIGEGKEHGMALRCKKSGGLIKMDVVMGNELRGLDEEEVVHVVRAGHGIGGLLGRVHTIFCLL